MRFALPQVFADVQVMRQLSDCIRIDQVVVLPVGRTDCPKTLADYPPGINTSTVPRGRLHLRRKLTPIIAAPPRLRPCHHRDNRQQMVEISHERCRVLEPTPTQRKACRSKNFTACRASCLPANRVTLGIAGIEPLRRSVNGAPLHMRRISFCSFLPRGVARSQRAKVHWQSEGDVRWRPLSVRKRQSRLHHASPGSDRSHLHQPARVRQRAQNEPSMPVRGRGRRHQRRSTARSLFSKSRGSFHSLKISLMEICRHHAEAGIRLDGEIGRGAVFADLDGDGCVGSSGQRGGKGVFVFRNAGRGHFTDVTANRWNRVPPWAA